MQCQTFLALGKAAAANSDQSFSEENSSCCCCRRHHSWSRFLALTTFFEFRWLRVQRKNTFGIERLLRKLRRPKATTQQQACNLDTFAAQSDVQPRLWNEEGLVTLFAYAVFLGGISISRCDQPSFYPRPLRGIFYYHGRFAYLFASSFS